jgi:hypothetical protein
VHDLQKRQNVDQSQGFAGAKDLGWRTARVGTLCIAANTKKQRSFPHRVAAIVQDSLRKCKVQKEINAGGTPLFLEPNRHIATHPLISTDSALSFITTLQLHCSVCEHGRQKRRCKACGGSALCTHGRVKYTCKDCGGGGVCTHGRH